VIHLLPHDIGSRLNVGGDGGRPGPVRLIHHPNSSPNPVLVDGVLGKFDELEVVDLDVSHTARARGHPGGDWTLVAVEPLGPVEGDAAVRTNLGNGSRGRAMDKVAGNVGALKIVDRGNAAATKGDPGWGGRGEGVDGDIPPRVTTDRYQLGP
jgi:hypothetical protein